MVKTKDLLLLGGLGLGAFFLLSRQAPVAEEQAAGFSGGGGGGFFGGGAAEEILSEEPSAIEQQVSELRNTLEELQAQPPGVDLGQLEFIGAPFTSVTGEIGVAPIFTGQRATGVTDVPATAAERADRAAPFSERQLTPRQSLGELALSFASFGLFDLVKSSLQVLPAAEQRRIAQVMQERKEEQDLSLGQKFERIRGLASGRTFTAPSGGGIPGVNFSQAISVQRPTFQTQAATSVGGVSRVGQTRTTRPRATVGFSRATGGVGRAFVGGGVASTPTGQVSIPSGAIGQTTTGAFIFG